MRVRGPEDPPRRLRRTSRQTSRGSGQGQTKRKDETEDGETERVRDDVGREGQTGGMERDVRERLWTTITQEAGGHTEKQTRTDRRDRLM